MIWYFLEWKKKKKRIQDFNSEELSSWVNENLSPKVAEIFKNEDIREGKSLILLINRKGEEILATMGIGVMHRVKIMEKIDQDKRSGIISFPKQKINLQGVGLNIDPLPPSSITYTTNELGRGTFGKVVEGTYLGTKVAIKILHSQVDLPAFSKEVQLLLKLRHPCCVTLIGYLITPEPSMVMEILSFNLNTVIYNYYITLDVKKKITKDIISGLKYLHSLPMIHRDMKPANILLAKINDEFLAKISDFGTAKVISYSLPQASLTNMLVGTPYYMAPEIINHYEYSPESDLYALGVIIYEIFEQKKILFIMFQSSTLNHLLHRFL